MMNDGTRRRTSFSPAAQKNDHFNVMKRIYFEVDSDANDHQLSQLFRMESIKDRSDAENLNACYL
jgi:hypothetical protein